MPKGNPTVSDLNFKFKVWDGTDYRPVYIAPEGTDKVSGDVKLSDAIDADSSFNAATGTTAATPYAVSQVNAKADKKLDKETESDQTVKSNVTFSGTVTSNDGFYGDLTGDVTGNADTASALSPGVMMSIVSGSQENPQNEFTGAASADGFKLQLNNVDASTIKGVLALENIPKAAVERVVSYESVEAAIAAWTSADEGNKPFDIGDTVRITGVDPNVMYSVVADPSLEESYVEYAAGTATEAIHAEEADVATKLGTSTVGSGTKPIYLIEGVATQSSSSIGNGQVPIYMESGEIKASTDTVGSATSPVYLNGGQLSTIGFTIEKNVPSSAVFEPFTGATQNSDGTYGYVPAPDAGLQDRYFLKADGTWAIAGEVTGVKGDAEEEYRVGDINLTAEDIGAVSLENGGIVEADIYPAQEDEDGTLLSVSLGSEAQRWANVYADNINTETITSTSGFVGNLTGTADNADKLNKSITFTGVVSTTPGTISLDTEDDMISIDTDIADKSVTNGKLADDVGTVYIGETEPTEEHIKLWIKI